MTIHKTAYDTTACAGLHLGEVYDKIKEAVIRGQLTVSEDGIYEIRKSASFIDQIPSFFHPVVLDVGQDGQIVVVDMRAFCRVSTPGAEVQIVDQAGYNLARIRAKLTKVFNGDYRGSLIGFSPVPVNVFMNLIADQISRRLNIGPSEHFTIQILAGIYYYSLFEDQHDSNSPTFISRVSIQLFRATNINAQIIKDIAEKASPVKMTNIDSFCDAVKLLITNVRIKDLNFLTLASMLTGLWYGPQGRELINVALENPPTLLALIYQAYSDRGFRKTGLAQLLDNSYFKKQNQNYVGAINNMTR